MLCLLILFGAIYCPAICGGCTQSSPAQEPVQPQQIYVAPAPIIAAAVPVSVVRVRASSASFSSVHDDLRPMTLRQAIHAIDRHTAREEKKQVSPSSHSTLVLRSHSSLQPGLHNSNLD